MINNLDDSKTINLHKALIKQKFFLYKFYVKAYQQFKKKSKNLSPIVELGSGGGFLKEIIPLAITSDIVKASGIDKVFSAEKMPFKDQSIGAFLMLNVLHHIKNPQQALKEMERCLKKDGKIIMTETYNSLLGRLIYQNFHHENFNPQAGWKITGKGRLSDANVALPWIIFIRDRPKFEKKFPNLKIVKIEPHTPLLYLVSGGLSKWQFLPNFIYPLLERVEKILNPFNNLFCMFATIEIQKNKK